MLGSAYGRKTEKDEANISASFTTKFASYSVACDIKEFGAAHDALGPSGDLKDEEMMAGEDQTKFKSQNLGDDVLSRSDSPTRTSSK